MSAPATAVVFDLGGVITESPLVAFAAYEAEAGLPEGLIVRLNSTDPDTNAWARFERNELDAAGFADAFDDDETGWPGGDLDVFADAGLPAEELALLLSADDLWADEMVLRIAERLGFADQLRTAAAA